MAFLTAATSVSLKFVRFATSVSSGSATVKVCSSGTTFFLVSFAASRSTFVVPSLSRAISLLASYLTALTASLSPTLGLALFRASLIAPSCSLVKSSGLAGSATSTFCASSSSVVVRLKGATDLSTATSLIVSVVRAHPLLPE